MCTMVFFFYNFVSLFYIFGKAFDQRHNYYDSESTMKKGITTIISRELLCVATRYKCNYYFVYTYCS